MRVYRPFVGFDASGSAGWVRLVWSRSCRAGAGHWALGWNSLTTVLSMDLLTWLIVGLIAGVLASLVMGGTGYGLIGDIIIGIVGAFVGGWLFRQLGVTSPFGGLAGTIFVAFIGAVVLLFVLRLLRRGRKT